MSIRYRPEVDGLRAISVVAIIIYHAEFMRAGYNLIPGAFLAVEVFFVISGFLITSLILKELQESNGFSVGNFYERRVRRLFPALLLVLTATTIGAWFILLPAQLVDFAYSLVASLFFVSNFYWDLSLQEYGAESGLFKPLLHTWTLAVEEQFYIVFPFMLIGMYKWFKHWLVWLLLGVFLVSLCFAQWHTGVNPHSSFYMLSSRYWELMAGAILAATIHRLPAYDSDTLLKRVLAALGLAIMLGSFIIFSFTESHHPGFMTTYTVLGTILVIGFCGGKDPVTRLLSSRPFVVTGVMSYSLYLWHFPIFAFARTFQTDISVYDKLTWIALTFVLSTFSYRFVEKPFRNRQTISLRQFWGVTAGFSLLIVVYSLYVIQDNGSRHRFSNLELLYGINEFDTRILKNKSYDVLGALAEKEGFAPSLPLEPSEYESTQLWFSSNPETHKVLIVGVSSSMDLFNAFYLNAKSFPGYEFARFGINKTTPEEYVSALKNSPNFSQAGTLLIYMALNPVTLASYSDFVEDLVTSGKKIVLISHPPGFKTKGSEQLFDWFLQQLGGAQLDEGELGRLFFQEGDRRGEFLDLTLRELAKKHDLSFRNMWDVVCDEEAESCTALTPDGYRTFYDHVHWTVEGARYFGRRIAELRWLDAPLCREGEPTAQCQQ